MLRQIPGLPKDNLMFAKTKLTWLTGETSTTTTLSRGRFEVSASCMVVLPPMLEETDKSLFHIILEAKNLPVTNQTDGTKLKF